MTTKNDQFKIYKESFESIPINQAGLARLMNLGQPVTRSARNKISDKLNQTPGKAITKSEALALQAIKLLHLIYTQKGLSINDMEFDKSGRITQQYIDNVLERLFKNDAP